MCCGLGTAPGLHFLQEPCQAHDRAQETALGAAQSAASIASMQTPTSHLDSASPAALDQVII